VLDFYGMCGPLLTDRVMSAGITAVTPYWGDEAGVISPGLNRLGMYFARDLSERWNWCSQKFRAWRLSPPIPSRHGKPSLASQHHTKNATGP
jgi:hypothetical protein